MNINSETLEDTIQNMIDNHPHNYDIPHGPYEAISVMGANGLHEMPDANQAVAINSKMVM
jgi:hypothetical protein